MRRSLLLLIVILLATTFAQRTTVDGEIYYETYVNERFDFNVNYPIGYFLPGPEPAKGDGLSFSSPGGRATLSAYGSHAAFYAGHVHFHEEINLEAYYASLLTTLPDLTYHALHPEAGWFVISRL